MARTKAFDEDEVMERAMLVFWRRGYRATSLDDLLAAMRLSKSSFYETFGTKRDLLLTAVERYVAAGMGGLIAPLRDPDAAGPRSRPRSRTWCGTRGASKGAAGAS